MKAATIKKIDYFIGVPLCFIFSIFNSIKSSNVSSKPKKVLFIKLIEQGASVLAYSALKESIDRYGKENVYFLVFQENRFILDLLDLLEPSNIIEIRNNDGLTFIKDSFKAILKLRKERIDASIDMEFFSRASNLFSYLIGAKHRVGLFRFKGEQPYRGNLVNYRVIYNPYLHVSKHYLLLLKALEGESSKGPALKVNHQDLIIEHPILQIDKRESDAFRKKFNVDIGEKIIVLNPNASDMLPLRKWESEKFGKLAEVIQNYYPEYKIVFTGLIQEKDAIDQLIHQLNLASVFNFAGKTSLKELMILYGLSDLVVSNDSGPAHFASLFNTNVLVLFGPETPQLFAPLSKNITVIYKNLACSPCVNVYNHRFSSCTNNLCIKSITVEEVFDKAKEILNERS